MIPSSYRVVEEQLPERTLLNTEDALYYSLESQGYQEHLDVLAVFLRFPSRLPFSQSRLPFSWKMTHHPGGCGGGLGWWWWWWALLCTLPDWVLWCWVLVSVSLSLVLVVVTFLTGVVVVVVTMLL